MLYVFGFEKIGVVVGDLYFLDPSAGPGQEGAERGVRLEVRFLERGDLKGSIYSAQPILVDRPIWRGDLLETIDAPGSHDRTHHHPGFRGWDPVRRHFVEELSAQPVEWVGRRLSDLDALVAEARVSPDDVGPTDADDLRAAVPEILDVIRRLLERVRAGELGRPPDELTGAGARQSWL